MNQQAEQRRRAQSQHRQRDQTRQRHNTESKGRKGRQHAEMMNRARATQTRLVKIATMD